MTVEDDLEAIRERRLAELKRQAQQSAETYGSVSLITQERELIHLFTCTTRLVIHFKLASFPRCAILSDHLRVGESLLIVSDWQ